MNVVLESPTLLLIPLLYGAMLIAVRVLQSGKRSAISLWGEFSKLLIVTLIALTLAGPSIERREDENRVPALVDISDSVDPDQAEDALHRVSEIAKSAGLTVDVIPFAHRAAPVGVPLQESSYSSLKRAWGSLNIGATNIEEALRRSLLFGGGSSGETSPVLLVSDGWETEGNLLSSLPSVTSGAVSIFPFTPERELATLKSFRVTNIYAPLVAPAQKSIDIRAAIRNGTGVSQSGKLEIFHDKKSVSSQDVTLLPGEEHVLLAKSDPSEEGIKEITAVLTPDDKSAPQSSVTAFLSGEVRERVLLINGTEEDARFLPELLKSQAYQLTSLVADRKLELPALTSYQVVVFNNVAVNQLSYGAADTLASYVKSGGGFIMIGGNRSFGLGGYRNTPVEEILPVELLPPQTTEKRINVAVQLVIDKSGSMGEGGKMGFATEAARGVISNLKDDDFVGIIGFDSAAWVAQRIGQLAEIRGAALERAGRLHPAGKTNLLPAIDEARRGLERVSAGRKHIIILTDGKVPGAGPFYVEFVKDMRISGITVSTVMLGAEADVAMLRDMASAGGGAFYQTVDASMLPRIFLEDVKTASGERTLKEAAQYAVRHGPDPISSTTISNFPTLKGYVETKPKPGASLELVAFSVDKAEPLLASMKVGMGKSLAFTSDANGRWSADWIGWDRFAKFFTELIDSVRPDSSKSGSRIPFDLRRYVEHGSLVLDLAVYSDAAGSEISGDIQLPDGSSQLLTFSQVTRGRFKAELPRAVAGKYELKLRTRDQPLTPVAFALSGDLFGERKGLGFNAPILSTIASVTGGVVNPSPDLLRHGNRGIVKHLDLKPWPLLLAALILCLEALRREAHFGLIRLIRAMLRRKTRFASR